MAANTGIELDLGARALVGAALALCAACAPGSSGGSSDNGSSNGEPTAKVVDGCTRVACKTVAVDGAGEVFDAAGGDLLLLHYDPPPALEPLTLVAPEKVGTRGLIVDLAVTPDYVYAATWKNGLVVVRRSDASVVNAQPFVGTEGAWRVDVVDADASCGSKRIVVVGTREAIGASAPPAPAGGRLVLLEHDRATDALELRASIDVGTSVQCVAASAAIAPPPSGGNVASFSVLLGADCARLAGEPGYLQRRDFSYACFGGALDIVEDEARAWPGVLPEPERIPRDIAIDEATARAYVAAYFHGVLAFDVGPGELDLDPSPSWPIAVEDGTGQRLRAYADTIALDPDPEPVPGRGARLVVGWGSSFEGEWQYFGDSSPAECAAAPPNLLSIPADGIRVYRLDSNDDPLPGAFGAAAELVLGADDPYAVAGVTSVQVTRLAPGTSYQIFAALDTAGMAVLRADLAGGAWTAAVEGRWDRHDPARLPLSAHDDALVLTDPALGDFLYVPTEEALAVFDLAAGPMSEARCVNSSGESMPVPCTEGGGGITLAGFANPNGRVVAATARGILTNPGGVRVYDISTPDAPLAFDPELDKAGRGFAIAAVAGAWLGAKPDDDDRARWVITTQSDASDPSKSFTVKLWDLGTRNDPHDPGCSSPCTPAALLATWQDAPAADLLEGVAVQEVAGGQELAVYVPYGVNLDSASSVASARAGVLVLRVTLDAAGKPHFLRVQKTVDFQGVDATFKAGRATFDPATLRLYACWGTGGIAAYDATSPYQIVRTAKRDVSDQYGAYHLRLSPTQVMPGPSACGDDFLYVTFLNDGVAVFDVDAGFAGPIPFLPLRGQAISLALDPADPTRRTIFVAGGRAGIEKLVVDPCGD